MAVPFIDLKRQYATIQADLDRAILAAVADTHYIMGPNVRLLEEELAAYLGVPHAIGCASGSDALLLALLALDLKPGDEVITTPFTFFATAGCIVRAGAKPVFADIDASFNIDPAAVEAAITPRTRAIIPVHLYGRAADMGRLTAIARTRGLALVEDCAQAIGAAWDGKKLGSFGAAGCISFFPTKNLGALGDGGMVVTGDAKFADTLRLLRVHGAKPKYYHKLVGMNSRLDELQAAALRVKLTRLDGWNARRIELAALYDGKLAGLPVERPAPPRAGDFIYHQYTILCDRRDDLLAHLKGRGIEAGVYYPLSLHLQECFADLGYRRGDMPRSEAAERRALSLPLFPEMTPAEMDEVAGAVRDFPW